MIRHRRSLQQALRHYHLKNRRTFLWVRAYLAKPRGV
jgi:hypothetical protein